MDDLVKLRHAYNYVLDGKVAARMAGGMLEQVLDAGIPRSRDPRKYMSAASNVRYGGIPLVDDVISTNVHCEISITTLCTQIGNNLMSLFSDGHDVTFYVI